MILLPVKNLSGAKQRLAAILDQPARTELAKPCFSTCLTPWPTALIIPK